MVIVSSEALDVIKSRVASEKVWGVRVLVKPAGCNGWMWELNYEDSPSLSGDSIYYECIAIDPQTLSMVEKIEIDMVKEGLQEQFVFNTPLSTAQCGCGESFAL